MCPLEVKNLLRIWELILFLLQKSIPWVTSEEGSYISIVKMVENLAYAHSFLNVLYGKNLVSENSR